MENIQFMSDKCRVGEAVSSYKMRMMMMIIVICGKSLLTNTGNN
jgi:hypothetical protein